MLLHSVLKHTEKYLQENPLQSCEMYLAENYALWANHMTCFFCAMVVFLNIFPFNVGQH